MLEILRGGVLLGALLGACGASAQVPASPAIPQPQVAAQIVQIPVTEASGLRFNRLSTADGLSQTRVAQIVQGERGFIWLGTQYGLDRYDGYRYKVFVHDPHSSNSLSGTFITALFKDRAGTLWIGCGQALDRLDPRSETFTHYRIDPADPLTAGGPVVHISQDARGILWLATGTGLHGLDPQSGRITHFRHDPANPDGLRSNDINWTGEDSSGHFWVGSADGLDEFDRATGRVTYHVPIGDSVRVAFFEDRAGRFWITHASGLGLASLDRASNTLTRYSFYPAPPLSTDLSGVMGMVEDNEGNLWLGSPGLGLLRLDRKCMCITHYGHHAGDLHSIAEDKVIALFADRDGNLWLGLHSKPPNMLARTAVVGETFKHDAQDPNSLTMDFVNAVYEDARGFVWIGNDDGLNRIDRTTHTRTSWTGGLGTKPMVIAITGDSSGRIWFGTFGHGLTRFEPQTQRFKTYHHDPLDPRSLSNDEVHQLFLDRSGTLWVGTDDGLDRFDARTDDFTVYRVKADDRRSQSYVSIAQDTAGTLWLGTHYSGLHHFDPATGRFIAFYRPQAGHPESLRDDMVPAVHVAHDGMIWIGTENGLNELDPVTGRFFAYDTRDGLAGNTVSCILEDDEGDLWIGTNRGLSRFDPRSRQFVNYSEQDGLPGDDLTGWSACFRNTRGELFFGGFPGALGFFPAALRERGFSPTVVLTDFMLSGRSVSIGADSPLKQSIAYLDRLTLTHAQSQFSVAFAGLNYAAPQTTRYRYRLDGLDHHWTEVGSDRRIASYTNLPPGPYRLRIEAASGRGPWSGEDASLRIDVLPPWWSTWWFRTACVALILLAIFWAHRLRLKQISSQLRMRLEERINERTRIAQELHDTLMQGLLSASLQIEIANTEIAADHPARPLTDGVFKVLRQLVDEGRNTLRGLRRTRLSENTDLGEQLEDAASELMSGGTKFRVIIEGKPQALRPLIHEEAHRIGREALANAFRHAKASLVEMALEYAPQHFRLVVRDDGEGMPPNVLHSGKAGHFGLSGMRERADWIGAKLKVRSAPNAGTEIDLIVPGGAAFERSVSSAWTRWFNRIYMYGANR